MCIGMIIDDRVLLDRWPLQWLQSTKMGGWREEGQGIALDPVVWFFCSSGQDSED